MNNSQKCTARHSREGGNPSAHQTLTTIVDSRLRGNDDMVCCEIKLVGKP